MKGLLSFLFLLACTSSISAMGKFITYSVDNKEYQGYYITPSKNAPLVIIIHDWDGLNEYEIKRAKMLNDLGYAAFAIDLYGKGVKPKTVKEKKNLTGALYKDRAEMRKLLAAGYQVAKEHGANVDNAVGIGYCFGGSALLEMARMGIDLKGFASFHGGLDTTKGENYDKTKGKIIIFHGGADTNVGMESFLNLQKELEKTKLDYEMIVYSHAVHAFTVFGTNRYNEKADKKSWKRFIEFLKETLIATQNQTKTYQ